MHNKLNKKAMNRLTKFIALASVFSWLGGCASSNSEIKNQYFLLDANIKHQSMVLPEQQVKLEKIELPSYLSQTNLVMKNNEQQIKVANYNLWADNLAESSYRLLSSTINNKQLQYGLVSNCRDCPRVKVDIHHFYPSISGNVVLSGFYRIQNGNTSKVKYFNFEQLQDSEGYQGSVESMQELMEALADDIAVTVSAEVK